MFLDQRLREIQESKNRLAICCDLRRRLVLVEVREICSRTHRAHLYLNLGLAVAERLLGYLREGRDCRR